MIQTTLNGREVLIVDVPEDATDIEMLDNGDEFFLSWVTRCDFSNRPTVDIFIDVNEYFPTGAWSIVGPGLCSEVKEYEAHGLVELVDYDIPPSPGNDYQGDLRTAYRDYESDEETGCSEYPFTNTAVKSLHSFIRSNGKDPSKVVLLINQNKTPQTTTK